MADKGFYRSVVLKFDKEAGERMQWEARDALERAGKLGAGALEEAMKEGGSKAGHALSSALRREYDQLIGEAKVKLAKGLISPDEFKKIEQAANRTFNQKLVEGMEKLRAEGKLTDNQFADLAKRLKKVGDEGEQHVGRVGGALEMLKGKALAVGSAFVALFAFDRIKAFGRDSISAFLEAEESLGRLNAMVRANGGAVERTGAQLVAFSEQIQKETMFQAGEIELAMSQLLSYHSIAGDTYERTIRVATDLSSVYGGLSASTEALARALDDPIAGLAMLSKQGFKFDDAVRAQIKSLTEQNRLLEAQDLILSDLESQVGGVAREMKTGMGGALDDLAKAWLKLKEHIGAALLRMSEGETVVRRVTSAIVWMARNADELLVTLVAFGKALVVVAGAQGLRMLIGALGTATASLAAFRVAFVAAMPQAAVIGALIGLTELFRRSGQEAADAAAKVDEFRKSLDGLRDMNLSMALGKRSEIEFRIKMAADLDRQIADIGDKMKRSGAGAVTKEERDKLVTLQRLRAEIGSVDELKKHLGEYNQQIETLKKQAPDLAEIASENVDNLTREVEQLRQVGNLRALTGSEARRLETAEQSLREAVERGELTREQEIRALSVLRKERAGLAKDLKDEQKLRDELDRAWDRSARKGGMLTHATPDTPLAGTTWIEGRRTGGGSRFGSTIDTAGIQERAAAALVRGTNGEQLSSAQQAYEDFMRGLGQSSMEGAAVMTNAFEGFFDSFFQGLETGKLSLESIGDAAAGVGASVVKGMTEGLADWQMAEGAIDLAGGAWPPNPAQLAAASLHFAAAGAAAAVGSWASQAAGGATPAMHRAIPQNVRDVGLSTYASSERMPDQTIFYVQGFDPGSAKHQDMLVAGMKNAARRDSSIEIRPWDGKVRG